jgi:hypothetical protein
MEWTRPESRIRLGGRNIGKYSLRENLRESENSRISLRVEVSLFVLSPEIEDRDEVEVATGRILEFFFFHIFVHLAGRFFCEK